MFYSVGDEFNALEVPRGDLGPLVSVPHLWAEENTRLTVQDISWAFDRSPTPIVLLNAVQARKIDTWG